ncbi:bifunctional UDP-N-acetylglucosamine diphosphorylase/glucosamine-1-phosphate N-acetyltransferase GlmU [Roseibium sp. RKSG952]|uniref:bifunctional UDP-N-acetylglucosamine diphosphorylase/glucosamine-1-phosphate N-acetyltransferase GlmU n=1 Tax=Roseibium sp. RKSG952 TaxID=2529384 RepID=UPI0012BD0341|nr:bifunctional UDP-N-acetylglucosamine diphosphorylase/glucosamine-1-phosphate N-acetyltransferase GlmU [Roseibium sp. RKSG952]MTH97133.1 bifunctional UDP-N-acetylglucosamine diphosphorylase/glucosamine-1-phosphate N-acetyltransferase GlmU [Roseibium sp. RKSG952]
MTERSVLAIVLAAGLGTRMKSELPKVMHPIGGLPLAGHVLSTLERACVDRVAVVTGPDMEVLEQLVGQMLPGAACHIQTERLGTAHAALAAKPALEGQLDEVLVLFGDTPLITPETVNTVRKALQNGADVAVLGFEAANPYGYGRLVTENGRLVAIREEKDATEEERQLTLCNSGIMGFAGQHAKTLLETIGNDNAKGEYYLTDAVEIASRTGLNVIAVTASEQDVQGINTRAQLAECEAIFQARKRQEVLETGVTLLAPETVFFAHDTVIESDVVIEQNVVFGPGVVVETGSVIRAFSHLEGATVGEGSTVGPYARLRPGAKLTGQAHIGNFVEIKNTEIGQGAKVNHLSYIGDALVGAKTNIGAGTITCNYDGFGKHRTEIGGGSFIGSNATLVAPLSLGAGVYVAAGSTVTEQVPPNALVIGRGRQVVKQERASELRDRFRAAKEAKG